ncbi:MAG: extracellular solute-binding protein [Casimicrobiaceae bacterium]
MDLRFRASSLMTGATLALAALAVAGAGTAGAATRDPVKVTIFAAGTLARPFTQMAREFEKSHPDIAIQPQFGGSVKMVKQVTALKQQADIVAVADYTVIPKYMFGGNGSQAWADWYVGFVGNAITFIYTPKSRFAKEITADNWYDILSRKGGVEIGRSNPDTDPSGYQTLQMLNLAAAHYRRPGLAEAILENAPETNIRDTETDLISALQLGQIDYLAIYRSDALQHHFEYLKLPAAIDLSDPKYAADYAKSVVHTKNGALSAKPIVYALTIPLDAPHKAAAIEFVKFILGPDGQRISAQNGFKTLSPAYVVHGDRMPAPLLGLTQPWTTQ